MSSACTTRPSLGGRNKVLSVGFQVQMDPETRVYLWRTCAQARLAPLQPVRGPGPGTPLQRASFLIFSFKKEGNTYVSQNERVQHPLYHNTNIIVFVMQLVAVVLDMQGG